MSPEDNEMLTHVGAGTPMGELFRRFWLPAILSSEMPEPDAPPKRLRLLGEDLVAFRDSAGRVGILEAYCAHKLAPLYNGRNEDGGLRCVYHGWKFDSAGQCVDIPNLPPTFNIAGLKQKAGLKAYPTREAGGMIWIYMGPADRRPELPNFEWTRVPPDHRHVGRWLQRSNWAQGMEGEIDTSHISFLHREFVPRPQVKGHVNVTAHTPPGSKEDGAPVITLKETGYGFVYGARRNNDSGNFYWRVTQWFVPMYSMIPNGEYPRSGRAWVPVDDHHVMVFNYTYRADRAFTPDEVAYLDAGPSFPPPREYGAHEMPDGYVIDTYLPLARRSNDYQLDRERQKTRNFSGIGVVTDQDRALQENMKSIPGLGPGRIVDRSREMLVPSDLPVITARRIVLNMARDLQKGIEPMQPGNGELYNVLSMSALSPEKEFDEFLEARAEQARPIV
ncbi:MAG: putative dioxygenase [Noviherbaspirillum sp.]|nr:putative dioxygenase [Noviherbaspirillum sp.]MDB5794446.1 putative dioxygenase [Noviherbaspirillum sp.]